MFALFLEKLFGSLLSNLWKWSSLNSLTKVTLNSSLNSSNVKNLISPHIIRRYSNYSDAVRWGENDEPQAPCEVPVRTILLWNLVHLNICCPTCGVHLWYQLYFIFRSLLEEYVVGKHSNIDDSSWTKSALLVLKVTFARSWQRFYFGNLASSTTQKNDEMDYTGSRITWLWRSKLSNLQNLPFRSLTLARAGLCSCAPRLETLHFMLMSSCFSYARF